MLKGFMFDISS